MDIRHRQIIIALCLAISGAISAQPALTSGSRLFVVDGDNTYYTAIGNIVTYVQSNLSAASGDLTGTYPALTIAGDAVTSAKILNGTIATADLADNAVTSAKIGGGEVGTTDLADAAVTMAKINQASATSGQVIKWNGSAWAPAADDTGGGGVSDGDKGDISVTSSGATWTIDNDVVTNAKAANMADLTWKGRIAGSTGDPQDVTLDEMKSTLNIPTYINLSSDFSNSTTTLNNVTGMSFTASANTRYKVEYYGAFTSAATTTGIGLALDIPSGAVIGFVKNELAATTNTSHSQTADNALNGPTSGVRAASTNTPVEGWWIVSVGASGGTVQLKMRSEVASSQVTLIGDLGFFCYTKL